MRFAIATSDKFEGVFNALLAAQWQPLKVFTFSMLGRFNGESVAATADRLKVPVQASRLTDADLASLEAQGCEILVVASYRWLIGDWRPHLRYALNFHPSPLPEGRGPWPLVQALQEGRSEWGVSCHKLSPRFDDGDVLAQERFPLDAQDTQESLDLRCQMAVKRLAGRVAKDLPGLWERALPQGEGSYFKRLSPLGQFLDLKGPVEDIQRQLRAFGLLECIVRLGPNTLHVRRAVAWREAHTLTPGAVAHANALDRTIVVAAKDGYVALLKWSLFPMGHEARVNK